MKKLLAIISLTAFLCYGVQGSGLPKWELRKQIVNSGISVFIDFLDKVKNATERIVKDVQFKKSRILVREHLEQLREITKRWSYMDEAEDVSQLSNLKNLNLAISASVWCAATIRDISKEIFYPFIKKNLKTETVSGIWREMESKYLKGAPPINNEPMGFLSYLIAKIVVKSGLVNALKGGLDIVDKIDLNSLYEDVQMFMSHFHEKAAEISKIERQKETNDFLVSLRTASGLIVFYWDQLLEHTESLSISERYSDSKRRWEELTRLRNASEKYHVLIDPETRKDILTWTDNNFGAFSESMALKYSTFGNEVFGSDRFNQSNWAILKIATVHGLPVYEKLTESGFGISELNRFLTRVDQAIVILEGYDSYERKSISEIIIRSSLSVIANIVEGVRGQEPDDETLLPFKVMKKMILEVWDSSQYIIFLFHIEDSKLQESERELAYVKTFFINEIIKSGEFTKEQLDEAPMKFINYTRGTIEKVLKYADMAEQLNERIEKSILIIKKVMYLLLLEFQNTWEKLVE